jgi:hypothetical protein
MGSWCSDLCPCLYDKQAIRYEKKDEQEIEISSQY